MQSILVIGGSGFLGSHTADELSERGYKVTIFDKYVSPYLRADQEMVTGSMLVLDELREVMKGHDCVYHFGGLADIGESKERPYDAVNFNVMGTATALQAAVDTNVKRFIYASTMYVYSHCGSFYRASKQASEAVLEAYGEAFEIGFTILRYGSLYGSRSQGWNGLRGYIQQVVKSKELKYKGTGKERREFINVKDAAKLGVDVLGENYKNKAITVTGNQVLYIEELFDMIFEIAGVKKNVEYEGDSSNSDHYVITPYRYVPREAAKIVPREFIDIGQGILEIVKELIEEKN